MFQKRNTGAKRRNRADCLKVSRLIKVKKGYAGFVSDNLDFFSAPTTGVLARLRCVRYGSSRV